MTHAPLRRRAGTAGLLLAAAFAIGAMPVAANDGDVIRRGSCTGASDWKIKASPEDGRIEVEFEVDSNVVGQTWDVTLKHDGTVFLQRQKTTRAPSGSFEVERVRPNTAGDDVFVGRARNTATGEVCRGQVTF
jgi:hypothetical protein